MADNKNQHFVPRAHFKPFSVNGEGKCIHLYNLERMQAFFNAPVKNQCSRDYFYGRDPLLENAIQFVEGHYANCISSLQKGKKITKKQELILKRFAYLQHLRTEALARTLAEQAFSVASIGGSDTETPTFKEAVRLSVIAAMRNYSETMGIIDDLKLRIVNNKTSIPFVTSDNPCIIANRWHQNYRGARGLSFGIASAGVVFFLPVSPKLLVILFDGDIYSTKHSSGWIDTVKSSDVIACNQFQVINCTNNLYFGNNSDQEHLADISNLFSDFRLPKGFELIKAIKSGQSNDITTYTVTEQTEFQHNDQLLIHLRAIRPTPSTWPSFLKSGIRRFAYTNGTRAGFLRYATMTDNSFVKNPWRKVRV